MSENKSSVSKQTSYEGIGEYWDTHELDDSFFEGDDLEVEVDLKSSTFYFSIDEGLANDVSKAAANEGVKPGVLINQWIREKIAERRMA